MARNRHGFGWVFSRFRKNANTLLWINNIVNPRESVSLFQEKFVKKMARNWHEIGTELKVGFGFPFLGKLRKGGLTQKLSFIFKI